MGLSWLPMCSVIDIEDPRRIERFARRDPALHLYKLGDLDPFFSPFTARYGLEGADGELRALRRAS